VKNRIGWVKDSARKCCRDLEIEFQIEFPYAAITDNPEPILEHYAKCLGVSADVLKSDPHALIGSVDEIVDRLLMIRDETDISYMVFGPTIVEAFDVFANQVIPALS